VPVPVHDASGAGSGRRVGHYCAAMPNRIPVRDSGVQSVDRAISILQVLARRGTAGVTEIARELAVHKSTAFRLLDTLESRGLVEQQVDRGRYQLGFGVVQLAAGAARKLDLTVLSRPICQRLAEEVAETVNVAIHDGLAVISIDQVIGTSTVTSVNWVGQRTPFHATSAGQVFLAFMPPAQRDAILTGDLEAFTPHTLVDPERLATELALVRGRGYAVTVEEHEIGLAAVAAPLRGIDGDVVAAVTASGPTFRLNADTLPHVVEQVSAAAAAISQRNGYPKLG
jgi:IclR family transcriptional regulator, acetate operon repressor